VTACRAFRRAAVKVLIAAVVEAFVNAKLERTNISTALYAAPAGVSDRERVFYCRMAGPSNKMAR
jgi:hypothetical protein